MRLKFLGSGDAFGSGGRLNTCFFADRGEASFLIDCGASAMISIRRFGVVRYNIAGPEGLGVRLDALMEALFPGSSKVARKFPIELIELPAGVRTKLGATNICVTGYEGVHPSGSPSLALRVECDGKVLAYTGDTEWVDALLSAGRDADLLIAEAYYYDRKVRFHLDFATLREKLPLIGAKRLVLTHMSPDMLKRVNEIDGCEAAYDGFEVELF